MADNVLELTSLLQVMVLMKYEGGNRSHAKYVKQISIYKAESQVVTIKSASSDRVDDIQQRKYIKYYIC